MGDGPGPRPVRGAPKNRRIVDKVTLPAGDYLASYVTDGSHSPADWNAAPPADPLLYGLTLSVPNDGEIHNVALADIKESGTVIAELVRVRMMMPSASPSP